MTNTFLELPVADQLARLETGDLEHEPVEYDLRPLDWSIIDTFGDMETPAYREALRRFKAWVHDTEWDYVHMRNLGDTDEELDDVLGFLFDLQDFNFVWYELHVSVGERKLVLMRLPWQLLNEWKAMEKQGKCTLNLLWRFRRQ